MSIKDLSKILIVLESEKKYKGLNDYVKCNDPVESIEIQEGFKELCKELNIENIALEDLKMAYIMEESSNIADRLL